MPLNLSLPSPLLVENGAISDGCSCRGLFVTRGRKFLADETVKHSEDCVITDTARHVQLCAVLDGHGGISCSRFCGNYICREARACAEIGANFTKEWAETLFCNADAAWCHEFGQDSGGSTATLCIVEQDKIHVAHVGDSLAIILRVQGQVDVLTASHVASNATEARDVVARGGWVSESSGPDCPARTNGILEVTRAFGDSPVKPAVSCAPDFVTVERDSEQLLLIAATDGVWGVLSPEILGGLVLKHIKSPRFNGTCKDLATFIAKSAYQRWSEDDISVYVQWLSPLPCSEFKSTTPPPAPTVPNPPLPAPSLHTPHTKTFKARAVAFGRPRAMHEPCRCSEGVKCALGTARWLDFAAEAAGRQCGSVCEECGGTVVERLRCKAELTALFGGIMEDIPDGDFRISSSNGDQCFPTVS